jgi:S-formylglutathione hydrolase FrmB
MQRRRQDPNRRGSTRNRRLPAVLLAAGVLAVAACSATDTTTTAGSTATPTTTTGPSSSPAGPSTTASTAAGKPTPMPTGGTVTKVTIPGTTSKFAVREAYVYVPPAYLADPTLHLPVLMLLHGTPGGPENWNEAGAAPATANAYAAKNKGKTPIIVMPDFSGVTGADTQCVDGRLGDSETYLTVDVPSYMHANFRTTTGPGSMGVAGLSAGGFCSLMLTVRHPDLFSVFGDYSGDAQPVLDPPGNALKEVFGGDQKAYDAHDPTKLIPQKSFKGTAGWFEVGLQDPDPLPATQSVAKQAAAAGMQTCVLTRKGGHDFAFWVQAFANSLPWISMHLKIADPPVDTHGAVCTNP